MFRQKNFDVKKSGAAEHLGRNMNRRQYREEILDSDEKVSPVIGDKRVIVE
jgi:hypothetical protein